MVLLLRYRRLFHKAVFQRVRVAVIYRVALREPGEDFNILSVRQAGRYLNGMVEGEFEE